MELNGLFPIVRRWLVVILMATAMATVVGAVLGSAADKTYEAKAQLLVGPLSADSDTMRASGALAQTYAELATSGTVLREVAEELDARPSELEAGVRATANSTTRFLVVRARAHHPDDAADIVNSVTERLVELSREGSIRPEGQLRVLDPADPPGQPVSPRLDLIVPLAAVAGLLGSLTLVLLFEYVGDTAESTEKVATATGAVTIPVHRGRSRRGAARGTDPLRVVATQVELAAPDVRSVVLTGATDHDGSGGLVLDLAEVWAARRAGVLVIDAGAGEITGAAGLEERPGLSDLLGGPTHSGTTPVEAAPGLHLITCGPGGTEAIRAGQARALLDQLAGTYGLVVVHAPSAVTSAGALVWSQVADVTVLVARRFQARRATLEEVAVNLRAVHANLAFAILHDSPRTAALHAWHDRLRDATEAPDSSLDPVRPEPEAADRAGSAASRAGTGTGAAARPKRGRTRKGTGAPTAGTGPGPGAAASQVASASATATASPAATNGTRNGNGNGNGNQNGRRP